MRCVLVVDDEMDIAALFQQRFRSDIKAGNLSFVFAHSGEEALACYEARQLDIVLILSDIAMPGMSGLELLQRLKTRWPALPVVMVSAYGADKELVARELGADDFVSKPIDFEELRAMILSNYLRSEPNA